MLNETLMDGVDPGVTSNLQGYRVTELHEAGVGVKLRFPIVAHPVTLERLIGDVTVLL